ncbi:MAG: alpha/beta hydrolase [Bacilli bacterium]|nr:alpha/beta hydrolase [Bacilli bacterium]
MTKLNLTQEWDKVYPRNEKVNHKKVTFHNRFGIELAADMFWPKEGSKFPAIACAGAFGAVKEQHSGLYAQEMASRGFLTIAFDPSFTGESGGEPRCVASPDINTEDFQAAVDFLSVQDNVDSNKISIIGICGWGGIALNAASIDTRIKATVCITSYNMSRVNHNGYYDSNDEDAIYKMKEALNAQRIEDYRNGKYKLAGGVPEIVPESMPQFFNMYHDYYKTKRGYHPRSLNSNGGWNLTSALSFINTPQHVFAGEIRNAVLLVHGENAHSRYFSEDMFKLLKGDNKELLIVPNADHCDLYDGGVNRDKIPFDKIEEFIRKTI